MRIYPAVFFEWFLGCLSLIALSPTLFIIALLIRFTAGDPVVVADEMPNIDGTITRCLRFRTSGNPIFRSIGRLLRRYRLDESVGIWSVVRGDISLSEFFRLARG
jgi:undecaprenyl phosphate N,N'-diacetylbacillosamine 1-phosphate transferase